MFTNDVMFTSSIVWLSVMSFGDFFLLFFMLRVIFNRILVSGVTKPMSTLRLHPRVDMSTLRLHPRVHMSTSGHVY